MADVKAEKPFNKITVSDESRKKKGRSLKDNPTDYKAVKMANITFLFCIIFEVVGIMTILFFGMVGAQMSIYFMTFMFSLFLWRKHKGEIEIKLKKVEPVKLAQLSAITVCGIPIALFLNYFAGILSSAGADSAEDVNTYPLILSLVVFAVVPAVVEEFVFRGVILGAYSKVDVKAGIVISSLFFALLHFSFGSVMYGFFFGLLFAVIRLSELRCQRLLPFTLYGSHVFPPWLSNSPRARQCSHRNWPEKAPANCSWIHPPMPQDSSPA